jgi:hypothetical protein
MAAIVLSAKSAESVTSFVSSSVVSDRAKVKAVDALRADGVVSDMLQAPAKGTDRSFYDGQLKPRIILGFTKTVQDLFATDTKNLNDGQKMTKRYWQQQVGSKIGDLRNAMAKREAAEDSTPRQTTTVGDRLRKKIEELIDQVQKTENGITDPAKVVASLKTAKSAI